MSTMHIILYDDKCYGEKKSRKENRVVALEQQCCYFKENKVLSEKAITEKYLKEMKERTMKILGQEHSWQRGKQVQSP